MILGFLKAKKNDAFCCGNKIVKTWNYVINSKNINLLVTKCV